LSSSSSSNDKRRYIDIFASRSSTRATSSGLLNKPRIGTEASGRLSTGAFIVGDSDEIWNRSSNPFPLVRSDRKHRSEKVLEGATRAPKIGLKASAGDQDALQKPLVNIERSGSRSNTEDTSNQLPRKGNHSPILLQGHSKAVFDISLRTKKNATDNIRLSRSSYNTPSKSGLSTLPHKSSSVRKAGPFNTQDSDKSKSPEKKRSIGFSPSSGSGVISKLGSKSNSSSIRDNDGGLMIRNSSSKKNSSDYSSSHLRDANTKALQKKRPNSDIGVPTSSSSLQISKANRPGLASGENSKGVNRNESNGSSQLSDNTDSTAISKGGMGGYPKSTDITTLEEAERKSQTNRRAVSSGDPASLAGFSRTASGEESWDQDPVSTSVQYRSTNEPLNRMMVSPKFSLTKMQAKEFFKPTSRSMMGGTGSVSNNGSSQLQPSQSKKTRMNSWKN